MFVARAQTSADSTADELPAQDEDTTP